MKDESKKQRRSSRVSKQKSMDHSGTNKKSRHFLKIIFMKIIIPLFIINIFICFCPSCQFCSVGSALTLRLTHTCEASRTLRVGWVCPLQITKDAALNSRLWWWCGPRRRRLSIFFLSLGMRTTWIVVATSPLVTTTLLAHWTPHPPSLLPTGRQHWQVPFVRITAVVIIIIIILRVVRLSSLSHSSMRTIHSPNTNCVVVTAWC